MAKLAGLPYEILEYILRELPAKDILACQATCHHLRLLVDSSLQLQLIIEMAVEGFQLNKGWSSQNSIMASEALLGDVSNSALRTAKEVLLDFRQRLERRNTLHHQYEVDMSDKQILCHPREQFFDGFCGYATRNISRDHEIVLWNPYHIKWHSNKNIEGPMAEQGFSGPTEIRYPCPKRLRYFTWDASQDLLVLFLNNSATSRWDEHIELRSLFTNTPHLAAQLPIIKDIEYPGEEQTNDYYQIHRGQICGSFLIFQYNAMKAHRLDIYNWKAGQLVHREKDVSGYSGFSILTDNMLLILSLPTKDSEHSLKVLRVQDGACLCIFRLPFISTVGLYFVPDSFNPSRRYNSSTSPYDYNPGSDRIVAIRANYEYSIHVVISIRHILSYVSSLRSTSGTSHIFAITTSINCPNPTTIEIEASNKSSIPIIDWCDWGPAVTRWFTGEFRNATVCGSRLLITRDDETIVLLCDFNQGAVVRQAHQAAKKAGQQGTKYPDSFEERTSLAGDSEDEEYDAPDAGSQGGSLRSRPLKIVGDAKMFPPDWLLEAAEGPDQEFMMVTEKWTLKWEYLNTDPDDTQLINLLSSDVHCRLPFRVLATRLPTLFEGAVIYLGVNEIIASLVHSTPAKAFLF